jgi:hypothetical protein
VTDHICQRCRHQHEATALCDAEEVGQGVTTECELFVPVTHDDIDQDTGLAFERNEETQ